MRFLLIGLITYGEESLLSSSMVSEPFPTKVIAHELAHQWSGNLVTQKWWSDTWMSEGFATYFGILGANQVIQDKEYEQTEVQGIANVAFTKDAKNTSRAMSAPIENPNEIFSEKFVNFNYISYKKGALVVRMLRSIVRDDTFFGGLTNYFRNHQYSNTEPDDLWKALSGPDLHAKLCYGQLKRIMDSWILQPGYPIITVTRDYGNNTATIVQRRFLEDEQTPEQSCWWVPLTYTTSTELDFVDTEPKSWLECDEHGKAIEKVLTVPGTNDWILFNIDLSGFYRVDYDEQNWNSLIEELNGPNFKRIGTMNRAILIRDIVDLASQKQDYTKLSRLSKYLEQENELLPWMSLLGKDASFGLLNEVGISIRNMLTCSASS